MAEQLKTFYTEKVVPKLMEQFGYTNVHQVPKLVKVTVNRGLGEASQNAKALESSQTELGLDYWAAPGGDSRQEGDRGFQNSGRDAGGRDGHPALSERMYAFLNRLINLSLPRIRDFRGISPKSFDGRGNYTLGSTGTADFPRD
jgi:large subunit ribosomal protein L5